MNVRFYYKKLENLLMFNQRQLSFIFYKILGKTKNSYFPQPLKTQVQKDLILTLGRNRM